MTSERYKIWILVALVYAVAFVAEYKNACIKIVSRTHESATACVAHIEDIRIRDCSYKVECSPAIFDGLLMGGRNDCRVFENPYFATRTEEGNATHGVPCVNVRQFGQRFYDRPHPLKNLSYAFEGRSLSAIAQDDFNLRNAVFYVPAGTNGKHISLEFLSSCAPSRQDLPKERNQLQSGNNRQNTGEPRDPFVRRFWIFAISYLGGFCLCLRGGIWLQDWRGGWHRWFGWLFLILGGLSRICGPVLWFLKEFPSTWNWPI